MIRCACGDKFDEHEEYELHQIGLAIDAVRDFFAKARPLGQPAPLGDIARTVLDSNARHRALVPGIDYGEEIMPEERPVEAPKPDPFDPCQFCMHHRRAHDSGGCGKWLANIPQHGPHDGKLCYCTKFVEARLIAL